MGKDKLGLTTNIIFHSIEKICEEIKENSGLNIRIMLDVIDDVNESANETLTFYGVPFNKLNNYQKLAHLGYWIHRLHPVRVTTPHTIREHFDAFWSAFSTTAWGAEVRVEREKFEQSFTESLNQYSKAVAKNDPVPFNEVIAWKFIYDGIEAVWASAVANCDVDARQLVMPGIEAAKARYEHLSNELVFSLRYHNYSARGFAMLVESIFKVKGII